MGIRTVGELAEASEAMLVSRFGKAGEQLSKYARGLDDSPVVSVPEDVKSVGNGFTFKHDIVTLDDARIGIDYLADEIGTRLREKGVVAATVMLSIKNEYFSVIQRQKALHSPTDISREIATAAYEILREWWNEGNPIRMLTVTATNLTHKEYLTEQLDIFGDNKEQRRAKVKKKEETVDKIRQKYGSGSIIKGAIIDTDLGIYNAPEANTDKNKK